MLYFIPAWYQKDSFNEIEQYWYSRRLHTEFDDTVKQVQLFHRSGAYPFRIMLLGFAPNFRHFLHRQSVYRAPYWSCFDAIQEVTRKKVAVLSYHNLEWPEGIEFSYTPFAICALLKGKMYARVEFGEDGNPIEIDMFKNDRLYRRNIYDDRGFLSATVLFNEEEKPVYQDYLNENGIWKIRCFYSDGHVLINGSEPTYRIKHNDIDEVFTYSKSEYGSLEDVISEVLNTFLKYTDESDIFCAAAHSRNFNILTKLFADRKLILSFFEDRFIPDREEEGIVDLFETVDKFVVDSEGNGARICTVSDKYSELITDITPYDSRIDFGISQQLDVQNIMVPVDGLDEDILVDLIKLFDGYTSRNNNARIHFFTRSASDMFARRIYAYINANISSTVKEGDQVERDMVRELGIDATYEISKEQKFFVDQCVSELEVSKCMREQRVMVDLRDMPELFLQISAISGGIPQIVKNKTQYVVHEHNGFVIEKTEDVIAAIDFYLDNINNWNEAKIFSYELGKKYTTKVLLDKWKEVIKSIG